MPYPRVINFWLGISPMPMAGLTDPVTLPGLIVLQNTEILAPLGLSQLASPGAPAIYGILATVADMKTAVASTAAPEVGVVMHACTQMAKTYRMPSRADVGLSDSCIVDYQSGAETAFQMLLKQAARKTPMHGPIER